MKKIVSVILIVTMLFSLVVTSNVFAFDNTASNSSSVDSATYCESNGDIITIEKIETNSNETSDNMINKEVFKTRVMRNGQYEESIIVDLENDTIIHEYADGTNKIEVLSDVVTITSISPSHDSLPENGENGNDISPLAVDYIDNEHFNILPNGDQAILSGGAVYDGYRAMGNRGFIYAPNIYGYLQRQNSGILRTDYSNRFSFSAGTSISTAASIIVAAVTSAGWALAVSLVVAMIGPISDVIDYDWSVQFEKRTYKWSYRVRLNSNTGQIIYTAFRTKDYWKSYNEATGEAQFEYAGSRYDDGFLLSNTEMIKAAIDSYL